MNLVEDPELATLPADAEDADVDEEAGAGLLEQPEGEIEEAPESEEDTGPTLDSFVEMLWDNERRITEVPRKQLPAVIAALRERERGAYESALRMAYDKAFNDATTNYQRAAQVQARVAQLEALKADDPDQFADEITRDPAAYEAYRRKVAGPDPGAELKAAAQSILSRLDAYPDVRARIANSYYEPTSNGLARLTDDVMRELDAAKSTDRDAERRQTAAKDRKNLPRVESSEGATGGVEGRLTPTRLKAMKQDEIAAFAKKHGWDEINRVMAKMG